MRQISWSGFIAKADFTNRISEIETLLLQYFLVRHLNLKPYEYYGTDKGIFTTIITEPPKFENHLFKRFTFHGHPTQDKGFGIFLEQQNN